MNLIAMLQAINTETVPIIRVPWLEDHYEALDMGAYGVICPMINTAEDAKICGIHGYAPMGRRS